MDTLQELLARQSSIDHQIAKLRNEARAAAISRVRQLMAEHAISATDIAMIAEKIRDEKRKKVAIKYRDTASGLTWTGRGLMPLWMRAAMEMGKTLSDFAV